MAIGTIDFFYPNISNPSARLNINPSFVPTGVIYRRTPFQQRLVAVGGQEYIVQLSTAVELLLTLNFVDLPETDRGGYSGWISLMGFLLTTAEWSMKTFAFRDADGLVTRPVRVWSNQSEFQELAGQAKRAGFLSGTLILRQSIS